MDRLSSLDPELVEIVEKLKHRIIAIKGSIEPYKTVKERVLAFRKVILNLESPMPEVGKPSENVTMNELEVPQDEGYPNLKVRIYRPEGQKEALPGLFHIHGGGLIVGSIDDEDYQMAQLSEELNIVTVNVEYRLAPENPFPSPVEDCYRALVWVADHANELNIIKERIGIMGESAGGGLAAAVSLMATERNGPEILFQSLVAPMLDDRNITPSSHEFNGNWFGWPRELNILGWSAYLGDDAGKNGVSPFAAPARATDLEGLPPAYVEVGDLEVFRDEDVAYAQALMQNQVPVELHVYPGVFHSWYSWAPTARITKRALTNRVEWMRRQFTKTRLQ